MVRQILGAVAQFEKANLVSKLRSARDRMSVEAGQRIEGRRCDPQQIEAARAIQAEGVTSLRKIAQRMAERGITNGNGNPLPPSHVARLVRNATGSEQAMS